MKALEQNGILEKYKTLTCHYIALRDEGIMDISNCAKSITPVSYPLTKRLLKQIGFNFETFFIPQELRDKKEFIQTLKDVLAKQSDKENVTLLVLIESPQKHDYFQKAEFFIM
jgi:hypothetical protein